MSESFEEAIRLIKQTDADFREALTVISPIPSRKRPATFEQLAKIIVEQQVSLASAAAIWKRLSDAITPFSPEQLISLTEDELRALGLSRQKARYCHSLAEHILEGVLELDLLHEMTDEQSLEALIQVKGIGRWTAEIYQISCLGRLNIWPAGDVALQAAYQHLKKLPERPNLAQMDSFGEPFSPYRTVAAQILWRYYSDVVRNTQKPTPQY
ncbi:DNA-3-methyladenine glycosylase family protein [Sneathiella limimaris]|uniref:DNA-3-methyladenine glycosylase family protein n=1 Tax=Sneathiella limimaris TaxID=1964213 RepID=UPI00146A39EC|nr:DNA-3-methyladenine glycosylase [Sneathiella limimaris]